MTNTERKTACLLAGIYVSRMLGLFLIFPTFSLLAQELTNATPAKIGLALGIYSLAQALLQIPAGILSDVIGRKKVLFLGLSLFLIGSVLAASTHDINILILARLLQGMGAVSAVCLAYVADNIRPSEQSKVMFIIGISIAGSFVLSFIFGSMVASVAGLTGIFVLTSVLAACALSFAYWLPPPAQRLTVFKLSEFWAVVSNKYLFQVNVQVAILHMTLSSSFFLIPFLLELYFPDDELVYLYVPAILLAFFVMMPLMRNSRENVMKKLPIFWGLLALSLLIFATGRAFSNQNAFMLVLALFFFAFTFVEAMLPARLFELAKETSRGATSGVFAVYQYSGNFLGGVLGAKLYTHFSEAATISYSFYVLAGVTILVTVATAFMLKQKGNYGE